MEQHVKAFDREAIHAGNKGLAIDREEVAAEVERILARMSWAQKLNEIRGRQREPIDGLYHAGGDAALGIPTFKMVDGPRGARAGHATAFPVAIARAATFDVDLERRIGMAIGREVAAKGGNVLLAPTINLLRHPGWGRAQEAYSEDTYHTGAMGAAFVSGAQHHVLACPKHFALNNLENTRFEMSADVDARTLHEVYLPHFERCVVEAGAAMVMSAYNKVNGTYCGEHPELLTEILRNRWGFRGVVISDWFLGTRSTAPALNAGLDIEMPAPYRFTDENIEAAIERGELTPETIDERLREVLFQKLAWQRATHEVPDASVVECDAHVALAREAAEKSLVLLKNRGDVLPLRDRSDLRVAVVGDLAKVANLGDRGSSMVASSSVTMPLDGIRARIRQAEVVWFGSEADLSALSGFDVAIVVAGLTYRDEGEFIPTAQAEAEGSQLARGGDRPSLRLPERERDLIVRAARSAPKVVVVLEGGSAIEVREWIDEVDALLMAWYPGREGGHAIAAALFGEGDPSGRLPVSFPRSLDQLVPWDTSALHVRHGLLHGYRHLDHHGYEPEFPFGFGLSYTTFALSGLRSERAGDGFRVIVRVANTGRRPGATVVQLYVGCTGSSVPRAVRELEGFGRVALAAAESADMEFDLADVDLRYYDARAGRWVLEPCDYRLYVGFSSRDLPLEAGWRLDRAGRWTPTDVRSEDHQPKGEERQP
jgi:beta-glucosidase